MDPNDLLRGVSAVSIRASRSIAGLGLALPLALEPAGPGAERQAHSAKRQDRKARRAQAARPGTQGHARAERKSAETEAALKREIEKIGDDRRKLNQALIDTAAELRGVEAKIEATQDAARAARRQGSATSANRSPGAAR